MPLRARLRGARILQDEAGSQLQEDHLQVMGGDQNLPMGQGLHVCPRSSRTQGGRWHGNGRRKLVDVF